MTLCGELASKPLGALALIALGYRSLSVTPSALGPVKTLLLDVDAARAGALVRELIDGRGSRLPVRDSLVAFAVAEGLQF